MTDNSEMQVHFHIHEGASPEAVRAAVEAISIGSAGAVQAADATDHTAQPDPETHANYIGRAYKESGGKAKPLLEFLADNPGRLFPFTEVSDHLGFPTPRSLPGLLGSFGRRANHRYEGVWPFEVIWENDEYNMKMSQEAAEIINGLR